MRFKEKVAIVTGGGSGIGKETARRLVAEGASVVLNGRDEAKLEAAAQEIGSTDRVHYVAGDIARPAVGAVLVQRAEERFGGVEAFLLRNRAKVPQVTQFHRPSVSGLVAVLLINVIRTNVATSDRGHHQTDCDGLISSGKDTR